MSMTPDDVRIKEEMTTFPSTPSAFTRYQPLTNLQRGNVVQNKSSEEIEVERTIHSLASQGEIFVTPFTSCLNTLDVESGLSPLHLAAYHGHLSTAKLLLRSPNIDVNVTNHLNQTALFYASFSGHHLIVREIMSSARQKIDVDMRDSNGNTCLMFASFNNKPLVVTELLKFFPDITLKNNFHETAYTMAVKCGHHEIVLQIDQYLSSLFNFS